MKTEGPSIVRISILFIDKLSASYYEHICEEFLLQDFVIASEYLETACVVVPKQGVKEWEGSYWKLADFVVPESTKCVYQDGEQFLYTVTMFKKTMDAFKNNAREKKFIVR